MKVKMEPRDFLFGMMQLLDPFINFVLCTNGMAMPFEKSNRTRASFDIYIYIYCVEKHKHFLHLTFVNTKEH